MYLKAEEKTHNFWQSS